MPTTKSTEAETMAGDRDDEDDDDYFFGVEQCRMRDEARAKAAIADPVGAMRKRAESDIARTREKIADLNAELGLARLELRAVEACLLALGPVPVIDEAPAAKKAAKSKPAAKRAGKAG